MSKALLFLAFFVYLGVSPVYWLPGIDPSSLRSIKLMLIGVALVGVVSTVFKPFLDVLSKKMFGFLGFFFFIIASMMGLVISDLKDIVDVLLSYSLVFLMMWGGYAYFYMAKDPMKLLIYASFLMALFCLPSVVYFATGFPNLRPPAEYETTSLATAGFGAKRTGWSNGVSLFLPLVFLLLTEERKQSFFRLLCAFSAALCIIGSQLVVAGRGGLISSFIALIFVFLFVLPRRYLPVFGVVASLAVFLTAYSYFGGGDIAAQSTGAQGDLKSHFRLDRLESSGDNALDRFSAGRIGQYQCAWQAFLEKPIAGYGFTYQSFCVGDGLHNLWLRLLIQGGILLFTCLAVFVWLSLRKVYQEYRACARQKGSVYTKQKRIRMIYLSVIIQGVFISMVEPKALIGSFQATAVWWVVLGFSLVPLKYAIRK